MHPLNLRRAAACRLAILESGRADPWHYEPVPLTAHQREQWSLTVEHLLREGFTPIIGDPELAAELGCPTAGGADD